MRYLPINLDIRGRKVIIVGGGPVAERKCFTLMSAGADVTVIAPEITGALQGLCEQGGIIHLCREYISGDLENVFLVFAATNDGEVNGRVAEEAKSRGIMADITDLPQFGTFISPAVVSRGELLISVSTGGEVPALAGRIREELEARYGPEYAELTGILEKVREKLLTEKSGHQYNKTIILNLLDHDLPGLIKRGDYMEIDVVLSIICGPGFTLAELGIGKKDI